MSVQLNMAKIFPMSKPHMISIVLAPKATKVAPMTNSVAATCSPAYRPKYVSNHAVCARLSEAAPRLNF